MSSLASSAFSVLEQPLHLNASLLRVEPTSGLVLTVLERGCPEIFPFTSSLNKGPNFFMLERGRLDVFLDLLGLGNDQNNQRTLPIRLAIHSSDDVHPCRSKS